MPKMKRFFVFLLVFVSSSLAQVSVQVKTNKAEYLAGEPVFVVVEVKNVGTDALAYSHLDGSVDLTVQGTEKVRPPNLRGCWVGNGIGGGSGGGTNDGPVLAPGESTTFRYLLKDYKLDAGSHIVNAKGSVGVRWAFPNLRFSPAPIPPPKHKPGSPVPGADIDVPLSIVVRQGSTEELQRAYAPYVAEAESSNTGENYEARQAITEMAPEFLEKTIAGFATDWHRAPELSVKGLGQIHTAESRADLVKLYDSSADLSLRSQIVGVLAAMATPAQTAFFAGLLPGRSTMIDDQIRESAALGLGQIGGEDAARELQLGLSGSSRVRSAVATGLGNTESRAAILPLIRMYDTADATVDNEVCGALIELTHYQWCDGSGRKAAIEQLRWRRWWQAHGREVVIFGRRECPALDGKMPSVR